MEFLAVCSGTNVQHRAAGEQHLFLITVVLSNRFSLDICGPMYGIAMLM
jgi:hypothetical protein